MNGNGHTTLNEVKALIETVLEGVYVERGFINAGTPEFEDAWSNFEAFAGRASRREEVIQLFRDFGFDAPQVPAKKGPLEQFQTAHEIFQNPVGKGNPVSASLLTLRECIDAVVAALVRMRPRQEPAKSQKNKIVSIGDQFALPDVSVDGFFIHLQVFSRLRGSKNLSWSFHNSFLFTILFNTTYQYL